MILTALEEPTYEDPEMPVIRHCGDCQHFRQQGGSMGYCVAKLAYVPDISDLCHTRLSHPIKAADQLACDEILPIGYSFDF